MIQVVDWFYYAAVIHNQLKLESAVQDSRPNNLVGGGEIHWNQRRNWGDIQYTIPFCTSERFLN